MIIAATARAVERSTLTVNARSHPLIVDYLSEVFHGGRLQAQARFGDLRSGFPASVMGLHWHDVRTEQDVPGWETELAGAIALLHDWAEADVFDVPEPRTVGIVTPMRDNADVLGRHLEGMLPSGLPVERIAIGTPERFHGQAVDLMIVLPTLTAQMPDEQRLRLAADRSLYHDAVAAARIGVHVVGDAGVCNSTGGLVAELYRHTQFPDANPPLPEGTSLPGDPKGRLGALLDQLDLCYRPLGAGFRVHSRMGQTYVVSIAIAAEEGETGEEPEGL